MPAQAGIQGRRGWQKAWIPVYTGMTEGEPTFSQQLQNTFA